MTSTPFKDMSMCGDWGVKSSSQVSKPRHVSGVLKTISPIGTFLLPCNFWII
jgi:hypothetical protein